MKRGVDLRQTHGAVSTLLQATALTALVGLGACSSTPPEAVSERMSQAELAIEQARTGEAAEYAPLELQIAHEKLDAAEAAVAEEEFERAGWLAEEALASAQVAEAKAASERAEMAAQEVEESIQTLREEIARQQQQ